MSLMVVQYIFQDPSWKYDSLIIGVTLIVLGLINLFLAPGETLVSCLPELVSSDLFCLYSFMFIFSLSLQTLIRWLTHSVSSAHLYLSHSLCLTYLSHCIKNT